MEDWAGIGGGVERKKKLIEGEKGK
jgi:hypothetical protein